MGRHPTLSAGSGRAPRSFCDPDHTGSSPPQVRAKETSFLKVLDTIAHTEEGTSLFRSWTLCDGVGWAPLLLCALQAPGPEGKPPQAPGPKGGLPRMLSSSANTRGLPRDNDAARGW